MNKLAEFVNEKLKEKYVQVGGKPIEIETPYGVRESVAEVLNEFDAAAIVDELNERIRWLQATKRQMEGYDGTL